MRIVISMVGVVFLGLVMLSIATIFFAIAVPTFSRAQIATTAEAIPGSEMSGLTVTHTPAPGTRVRFTLAWFPICLLGLLVLGGIGLVVKLFRSDDRTRLREKPDEIRILQEVYQGLSGLERRVESLETILLDRAIIRDGEDWKRG